MARVSIGVPVYNGGQILRQSLECLRTQSFEDFEVTIGDNASADETGEICTEYAAKDGRFRHLRRPKNIGALPNFIDLRQRADSALFMWRAYDDLSDPGYLEALVGLFDQYPEARLAVPKVRSKADGRAEDRVHRYESPPEGRIAAIEHELFKGHASWVYGLWDRKVLGEVQDRVHGAYRDDWASDHLSLLPLILDRQIVGTNEVEFLQRILRGRSTRAARRARQPALAEMRRIRGAFDTTGRAEIDARQWTAAERQALDRIWPRYLARRTYSPSKLFWAGVREALRLR